jgi:hypothetical protein
MMPKQFVIKNRTELYYNQADVKTADLYKDLYKLTVAFFKDAKYGLYFTIGYVLAMLALSFHLWHGFQSAFQTIGVNSSKLTPAIKLFGKLFSVIVPLLFAIIPVILHIVDFSIITKNPNSEKIYYLSVIALILFILQIVSTWIIFVKAGQKGWYSLIAIYRITIELKILKKPMWWTILLLLPFVNIYFYIVTKIRLAKAFGKNIFFAIGLIFLPFVFYPILAFGDSKYSEKNLIN